jgi:hypothetical protein
MMASIIKVFRNVLRQSVSMDVLPCFADLPCFLKTAGLPPSCRLLGEGSTPEDFGFRGSQSVKCCESRVVLQLAGKLLNPRI